MQSPCVVVTQNEQQTQSLGERIASHLRPGDVLALEGDLGVGKTTFVQGVARGLGVQSIVNSPTFVMIKEYEGRIPLYHMDLYRIDEMSVDLGLDEYLYGTGVCVIEWPSRLEEELPHHTIYIHVSLQEDGSRQWKMESSSSVRMDLCREWTL